MEKLPARTGQALPTLRTTLSLEQRSSIAKAMLAKATTSTEASQKAKYLVGQWSNLKPDNPRVFIESVAAVLSVYPLSIVEECCDPRIGLASTINFFSIKDLTDWLTTRLELYQSLAAYQRPPSPRQIESGPITGEQCRNLMAEVGEALRANNSRSPLDILLDQRAEMRRLRKEEIYRAAYGDNAE